MLQIFLVCLKRTTNVAAAKKLSSCVYVIDTTCSDNFFFILCDLWKNLFSTTMLTLSFPMLLFNHPLKHQKTYAFLMFSEGSKGNIEKKRVNGSFETNVLKEVRVIFTTTVQH